MNAQNRSQQDAVVQFRKLHESGCFILPNPWDVGSAVYLHHLGFKALATTSAGYAFSRGLSDGKVSRDEMLAHIREIVAPTIDEMQIPVVLTGRCEAWLVGHPDPFATARKRLAAYAAAGADCLYAPSVRKPDEIAELVKTVAAKPLNLLLSRPSEELPFARIVDLGVRRISVGSALASVAWGAFIRAARNLATNNSFDSLGEAAPFAEMNELFGRRP